MWWSQYWWRRRKSISWFLNLQIVSTRKNQSWCSTVNVLTLVTTDKMAIPFKISCQTPMLCAFAATGLLYWVVNFQESTRISRILFIRARRGARGKDATKRVMNPNWMTAREKRKVPKSGPTEVPSGWQWNMQVATCRQAGSHLQLCLKPSDNLPQPWDLSGLSLRAANQQHPSELDVWVLSNNAASSAGY